MIVYEVGTIGDSVEDPILATIPPSQPLPFTAQHVAARPAT